ncbi:GNAT family N-acetyltransferase [Mycobacterium sp.]|uniref:GNAT family N-acetyltransferase n=1 Tax=Mycobacterium sp. TaxID=1785 RepID=UPI0025E98DF3|nr:GNAT family N-acetyltransferase [Mycobacterium sp.]
MLVVDRFLPQERLHLFNTEAFFRLHEGGNGHYFQWSVNGNACITAHFTQVSPAVFRSPARGTFGALSHLPGVTLKDLQVFISEIVAYLRERGGKLLQVLLPPLQHDPADISRQYFLFRANGFTESLVDLNYGQRVDDQPFAEKINSAKRQRLNKCRREGFEVSAVPAERISDVYDVITENRAARGYPMTMGQESLRQMQKLFPDAVQLYLCEHQGRIAAAAICLRLSQNVLYAFYWGDRPGYKQFSPVVLIAEYLYQSCQIAGIDLLDGGTGTLDLQPNSGLIDFKRELGFSESLKFRLEKRLEP